MQAVTSVAPWLGPYVPIGHGVGVIEPGGQ